MTREHHGPMASLVRIRNQQTASMVLVTLAAIATVTGCSSGDGGKTDQSPTPSSAAPTKTVSVGEAQTRRAVIAAYQGMTTEQVKAYAKASLAGSHITQYATGKALRDVKNAVFVNMKNGIVVKGEPKVGAHEDDVILTTSGKPHRASLQVCFDTNTWEPIDERTGKSVAPPKQVKRYTITVSLQRHGSRWLVTEEKADKEKSC